MRFSIFTIVPVVFAAVSALVTPGPLRTVETCDGDKTGKYIVVLKDGVSTSSVLENLRSASANVEAQWEIINGFVTELDEEALNTLLASEEVDYITEDGIMSTAANVTQAFAPWGLARISQYDSLTDQNAGALTFRYTYDDSAGVGVDVYIVDTGIYTAHSQFGGRARWGATFGGYAKQDGNGHGTCCASIVGGSQFGVAKRVNLIAC